MLALLGPSGCGKSTTLFAICGIHRVTGGRILFGDRDVSERAEPGAQRRRRVPVLRALSAHDGGRRTSAFRCRSRACRPPRSSGRSTPSPALVHIENLMARRPAELSGGQQQRVALARALVRKPDVLLLDEPLANLDAKLRLEMRSEIRRLQRETGITAILVTHDQVEAMSMCDRIAIMNAGKIIQIATPTEMYHNPRDRSSSPGSSATRRSPSSRASRTAAAVAIANSEIRVPLPERRRGAGAGSKLTLGIRPEDFGPAGDVPIPGTVVFVETQGRENLYDVQLADGSCCARSSRCAATSRSATRSAGRATADKIMVFAEDGTRL